MMRLTVEIVPNGDESARRTLAIIKVANMSELAEDSEYEVWGSDRELGGAFRYSERIKHARSNGWRVLAAKVMKLIAEGQR